MPDPTPDTCPRSPSPCARLGVVLMNMGGPDDRASIRPFLRNLFSDPDIIRLPLSPLLQPLLARWIVWRRGAEAEAAYARMDPAYHGGSPQWPLTRAQGEALQARLQANGLNRACVYTAMRYWGPSSGQAVAQMAADGVTHVLAVSLYPHFSYTTTGSSLKALRRALADSPLKAAPLSILAGYCQAPGYLAALAARIREGLAQHPWDVPHDEVPILFSAHSLPLSHVRRTRDPYPAHIQRCAEAVMHRHFPRNPWELAYQSKIGRMPWLAPATVDTLSAAAARGQAQCLVVPISFVSDHIETLVELDIDALPAAQRLGLRQCARAPVMNTSADFMEALAAMACTRAAARWPEAFGNARLATEMV